MDQPMPLVECLSNICVCDLKLRYYNVLRIILTITLLVTPLQPNVGFYMC